MSLDTPTTTTPEIPASAVPAGQDPAAYVAEMTNKVQAATGGQPVAQAAQETPQPAARPDYIPEKFWDATTGQPRLEDVFKSYTALETKLSKPEDTPAAKAEGDAAKVDDPSAAASTPDLGGAIDSFVARYTEANGEVTDADIAPLEKLGLPRETINTYLAGLQALERVAQIDAEEIAGSKENLDAALAWAASGLTKAEQDYYERTVSAFGSHKQGVEWLMGKFNAAHPSEGSFVQAQPGGSGDVFNSQDEMRLAMSDPKYASDPAYRDQVAAKLARSFAAGTIVSNARQNVRR